MTSRTNPSEPNPKQRLKDSPNPPEGAHRRHQAMARYLAGDKIEDICRELGCSKSWLYKWRGRYQAEELTWTHERTRRPRSNPRQLPERVQEAILHLAQTLAPQASGWASATAIGQALKDQAIAPLPSRRTIYRVLQRHAKEVDRRASRPSESPMEAL
jgi:transposase-like protein